MKAPKFYELLAAGPREAKIFALNFMLFVDMVLLSIQDFQSAKVEGCDLIVNIARWMQINLDTDVAALFAEMGIRDRESILIPQIIHGGAEVKAILPGKLIQRNDLGHCPDGAIPFAIWDGNVDGPNGTIKYTREKHGSLRRFFEPEWMPLSTEPLILAYMPECYDRHGHPRPFASIVFTNFIELKQRLIAYAASNGLNLEDWDSIPVGDAADTFSCGNLIFSGNMWFVPLHLLVDTAKIIIIGEPPQFYRNGTCTVEMQMERYQFLCDHADAFIPYGALIQDGEITATTPAHLVHYLLMEEAQDKLHTA